MSSGLFGSRPPALPEPDDKRRVPGIGSARANLRVDRMASKYTGKSVKASKIQHTKGSGKKGC